MASTDEDNFDIDIYGDGEGEMGNDGNMDYKDDDEDDLQFTLDEEDLGPAEETHPDNTEPEPEQELEKAQPPSTTAAATSQAPDKPEDAQPNHSNAATTKPAPQQGVKRKESSDDRPIDHGATHALMISELHWWITEDEIRGWAHDAGAEDELRELTFSEHKVNGKSKGQVYLEFSSAQGATATKHKIDSLAANQPSSRKHSVVYTSATQNPFKTLPKDAPVRTRDERPVRGGTFNSGARQENNYNMNNQGFRGGRGSGFNRGGYSQYNRNFSGPMGGGYNHNSNQNMNFQGNMGMGTSYGGGFNNRGGMMGNPMRGGMSGMGGMRGGRGGMNNMMPMGGGMGMGNMGMNPMMAGMGMGGFQGNQFNPGMFNSGPGPNFGGGDWNQQGAKRQRQE